MLMLGNWKGIGDDDVSVAVFLFYSMAVLLVSRTQSHGSKRCLYAVERSMMPTVSADYASCEFL